MSKRIIWTAVIGTACVFGIAGVKKMRAEVGETIETARAISQLQGTLKQDEGMLLLLADAGGEEKLFKGEGNGGKFRGRMGKHFPFMKGPLGDDFRNMMSGNLGRWMVLRSEVDLTDEQREEMKEIFKNNRTEIRDTVSALVEARMALVDQVLADEASEEDVKAAADKMGDAIGEAALFARTLKGEVKEVLTEEQQKKVREVIDTNRAERREFHQKMKETKLKETEE